MHRLLRFTKWTLIVFLALCAIAVIWYWWVVPYDPPAIRDKSILQARKRVIDKSTFVLGNNWLKQDSIGLWQLYVEGDPFERGAVAGILCRDLLDDQEAAFVEGMDALVPSRTYLHFLKYVVSIFTRNLPDYIDQEYLEEIYGVSQLASDRFDFIGPKYQRKLNFHAAHDIGHALQTQGLVSGCTMLATNPQYPKDYEVPFFIGRNFDFYVGDAFARQKLVTFMRPEKGIPFAMIGWPGMMGAVSGMNTSGLAIALNAGPSQMPSKIGTPVTLLSRKVLQYASTIDQAAEIIHNSEIFVSENIIVASGKEGRVVVFEKSPKNTSMYESKDSLVVCSNHFQSAESEKDSVNIHAREETSSGYRYIRMTELANSQFDYTIGSLVKILRNTRGIGGQALPLGSELSINQLTAHHSVIFDPVHLIMWVACSPSQAGPYLAYDLNNIFNRPGDTPPDIVNEPDLRIEADELLNSESYLDYLEFKKDTKIIERAIEKDSILSVEFLDRYAGLNPLHYITWLFRGRYFAHQGSCELASREYEIGLSKPLPGAHDRKLLTDALCKCDSARCP